METIGQLGEDALIERLRACVGEGAGVELGVGDDAAVIDLSQRRAVVTADAIVEGEDWLPEVTPWDAVGHRAVAVNLSDLAAMGAQPVALLCVAALPSDLPVAAFDALVSGLVAAARRYGCTLCGGDLQRSAGPVSLTVTAIGRPVAERVLTRSGARSRDALWVVGALGRAALGLQCLERDLSASALAPCVTAHLWPVPRVEAGLLLVRSEAVHAAMDVSDGLVRDLGRLARASGLAALIEADPDHLTALPPAALEAAHALGLDVTDAVLHGGDDYALLVAAQPDFDLTQLCPDALRVGHLEHGAPGSVMWRGAILPTRGHDHFTRDVRERVG